MDYKCACQAVYLIISFTQTVKAVSDVSTGDQHSSSASGTTDIPQNVTCNIPSVNAGQKTTLTCDFKKTMQNSSIIVYFHGLTRAPNKIVNCHDTNMTSYTCLPVKASNVTPGNVTRYLEVTFNADKTWEGEYECVILPERDYLYTPCSFTLRSESDSSGATGFSNGGIIGIALGIVVLLTVLVVAVACRRRQRADRSSSSQGGAFGCRSCSTTSLAERARHGGYDTPASIAATSARPTAARAVSWSWGCCYRQASADLPKEPATGPLLRYKETNIDLSMLARISDNNGYDTDWMQSTPPLNVTTEQLSAVLRILQPYISQMESLKKTITTMTPPQSEITVPVADLTNVDDLGNPNKGPSTAVSENGGQETSRSPSEKDRATASKTVPSKPTDWPPLDDLERQKYWIEKTLTPYVGCTSFPKEKDDASRQLTELQEVQEQIRCQLEDLRKRELRGSSERIELKDSVISKLEAALKLAAIRTEALHAVFKDLVRTDHRLQNAIHDMNLVAEQSTATCGQTT